VERAPGETVRKLLTLTIRDALTLPANDAHFVTRRDNQQFFALDPGNPNLWTAPRGGSDDPELPIRLRRGNLRHLAIPTHQTDAALLGYRNPLHLLVNVIEGWEMLHQGTGNRLLLVLHGGANAAAVVESARSDGDDYWRVVTVGRRHDGQIGKPLRARTPLPETATGERSHFHRAPSEADEATRLAQGPSGTQNIGTQAESNKPARTRSPARNCRRRRGPSPAPRRSATGRWCAVAPCGQVPGRSR